MEPVDPLRFRPRPTLTGIEVAERAGLPHEFAERVFRALGFPDVPDDYVEFDERDVEVLGALRSILAQGYTEDEIIVTARTYGYALSRVAQAEIRLFRKRLIEPLREKGVDDEALGERLQEIVPGLLDVLSKQLDHVHRRHLGIALQQAATVESRGDSEMLAAAFVDLVAFSRTTHDLAGDDLGELVSRFETVALERCVDQGAHVVKMIGDAVMLVAPQPGAALAASLAVVDAAERDPKLPEARAGVDFGRVVSVGGDFFGRPVNLAARLTSFAKPGSVVVSAELLGALPDQVDVSHIGKMRFKGMGSVRTFKVNAYPAGLAQS